MSRMMIESLEGRDLMSASFAGDAYLNEMGVIAAPRPANGIIAILIGLHQSPQPAGGEVSSAPDARG